MRAALGGRNRVGSTGVIPLQSHCAVQQLAGLEEEQTIWSPAPVACLDPYQASNYRRLFIFIFSFLSCRPARTS